MKTITVKLSAAEVNVLDQPVLLGIDIARLLRKAGVPNTGKLWPYRVATGKLVIEVTPADGVTFTWTSTPGEVVKSITELGVKVAQVDAEDEDLF